MSEESYGRIEMVVSNIPSIDNILWCKILFNWAQC